MSREVARLYRHLKPDHYRIHLVPDYQDSRFHGTETLTGELQSETSTITLHASGLDFTRAHVNDEEAEIELDQDKQHVYLKLQSPVPAGRVTIESEFNGNIKDTMHGLYWSRFTHNDEEKYLIATQFEANHARDVFPSVDEPEAKAVFELSAEIPKSHIVVSNTPIAEREESGSGSMHVTFEPTPTMSTYLLALVAGELDYRESSTAEGTTVRVYATPDNVAYTDFALQTATTVLEFYNDYFEIPHPLSTCDLIALPDFAAGAMENWGCITFREAVLLVDPQNTSLGTKQLTANVISHELAHQWFGDLVTMQWWNDLWLNEGFATWIANLAVDHAYPEWNIWEQFAGEEQLPAMRLDSLTSSHPVEVPIHDPEEIDEIFDAISYCKGASALHMLHEYLGAENFRRGLSHYLQRHAYQNTRTNDLWEALAEVSDKPVKAFMSSWTQQTGYPLLQYEQTDQGVRLTQQRFLLLPDAEQETDQTWYIPVSAVGHENTFLLDKSTDQWEEAPALPAKFNAERNGLYRVYYPENDLTHLFDSFFQFSSLDRSDLIDNTFELTKAGYGNTASALSLLKTVKDEESDVVWDIVSLQLTQIQRVFGEDVLHRTYGAELTDTQLQRVGWDEQQSEPISDTLLRPIVLILAAKCRVESVIKETFRRFRGDTQIDPNIRRAVYTTVARNGGDEEYQALRTMHNQTDFAEEKQRLAQALCSFTQTPLVEQSLAMITSDHVRKQEVRHWMAYIFSNTHAKEAAWRWLQDNWQWLEDNFRGSHAFPDFPKLAARGFCDHDTADAFEDFFRGKVPDRSLDQAIENIRIQAAWKERDQDEVDGEATEQ